MDFSSKTRAISSFSKEVKSGKFNMHHKLQRKEGQWSNLQRGELIDSLLRSYPIDPIRCEIKDDGIRYVFDGVQRSTNICNYFNDGFRLPRSLKPVILDGVEYVIAGKKFSQLDEAAQDKIKNSEITVYMFTGCTEDDIREMYRRQNNGKSLSNTQKRTAIESDAMSEIVFSLADHAFFDKLLSPTQIKRDLPRDIIRETLMLIMTNDENDFTSFRSGDINNFVTWFSNQLTHGNIDEEITSIVQKTLDKFDESFADKVGVNVLSIPMMIYSGYQVLKDKKSFDEFIKKIEEFVSSYDTNDEYKQYCSSGTSASDKVRGRFDYWKNIVDSLV